MKLYIYDEQCDRAGRIFIETERTRAVDDDGNICGDLIVREGTEEELLQAANEAWENPASSWFDLRCAISTIRYLEGTFP